MGNVYIQEIMLGFLKMKNCFFKDLVKEETRNVLTSLRKDLLKLGNFIENGMSLS